MFTDIYCKFFFHSILSTKRKANSSILISNFKHMLQQSLLPKLRYHKLMHFSQNSAHLWLSSASTTLYNSSGQRLETKIKKTWKSHIQVHICIKLQKSAHFWGNKFTKDLLPKASFSGCSQTLVLIVLFGLFILTCGVQRVGNRLKLFWLSSWKGAMLVSRDCTFEIFFWVENCAFAKFQQSSTSEEERNFYLNFR